MEIMLAPKKNTNNIYKQIFTIYADLKYIYYITLKSSYKYISNTHAGGTNMYILQLNL